LKKPDNSPLKGHPRAAFLEYLEDRLSPEDRDMVKRHIDTCEQCSVEVRAIERLITSLKNRKEAFCPEPWQWHEFVKSGSDPKGELLRHLEACGLCAEEIAALRAVSSDAVLPNKLRVALEKQPGKLLEASRDSQTDGFRPRLFEWLRGDFRLPSMALSAVAVAILAVVLIYPRGDIEPMIGLSSVTWGLSEDTLHPKGVPPEERKPRVAVVLVFKGFKTLLSQNKIDELYEALKPPPGLMERYDLVAPSEVKAAIRAGMAKPENPPAALATVARDLHLSRGLLVTISPEHDKFRINASLLQAPSGALIRQETLDAVAADQLSARLRDVLSIVNSSL